MVLQLLLLLLAETNTNADDEDVFKVDEVGDGVRSTPLDSGDDDGTDPATASFNSWAPSQSIFLLSISIRVLIYYIVVV